MLSMQSEETKELPHGKATMVQLEWRIKWAEMKPKEFQMKLSKKAKKIQQDKANITFVYWQIREFGVELGADSGFRDILQTLLFSDIHLIRVLDNHSLALKVKDTLYVFRVQEHLKASSAGLYRSVRRLKKKSSSSSIKYRVKRFEMKINFGLDSLTTKKIDLSFDFEKIKLEMAKEKKKKNKRRKSIELEI